MKTMKTVTTAILLLMTSLLYANDDAYDKAMTNALTQLREASSIEELQSTANSFARIWKGVEGDWLAPYYQTQCLVLMSFREKEASKKDAYLNEAEVILEKLIISEGDNSEIYALQSLLYTARLTVDPMNRGQEYMGLSGGAYRKALALNPTNPRALYLQLSNEVGMANFFNDDTSVYCDRIIDLYRHWNEYNQVEKFNPSWGLNQLEGLMQNCPSE